MQLEHAMQLRSLPQPKRQYCLQLRDENEDCSSLGNTLLEKVRNKSIQDHNSLITNREVARVGHVSWREKRYVGQTVKRMVWWARARR